MGSVASENNIFNLTPQEEDEACVHAMLLGGAQMVPLVLKAALELDVFEIIAEAARLGNPYIAPSEIASKLSSTTNKDSAVMLDRMLRLLASNDILRCKLRTSEEGEVERLYGLAPVCKFLIKDEEGLSLASMVLLNQDKVFMECWYQLKDAVLHSGIPFNRAHGMDGYEYNATDPRFNKVFNKGMSDISTIVITKIVDTYKGFEGVKSMVDVGGGIGATINMIVSKYPNMIAINFDLPHVIQVAPKYPGVEHIGGNMFVCVPKADVILMRSVLHNWSDEHCVKILKNCYNALPSDGKIIILEAMVPTLPESSISTRCTFQIDNVMMASTIGGKSRTKEEFAKLSTAAGYADCKVICCIFNTWVIEFYKMI